MKTRNKRFLFEGIVVALDEMEVEVREDAWYRYQTVRHPGGVGILPLHPDGTVTLVRQFRPSIHSLLTEIPAGRLSAGERPEDCARRELLEETGLRGGELLSLGFIYSTPGFCDEKIHLFLARNCTEGASEPEEYEEIEAVRLPLQEAVRQALSGEISDAKTVAALLRAREGLL